MMSYTSLLQVRSFLFDRAAGIFLFIGCLLLLNSAAFTASDSDPFNIRGFDCSQIDDLGIDKQMNHRAGAILRYCATGRTDADVATTASLVDMAYPPSGFSLLGGTDINLITGTETHPRVTQAESAAWGHGNTIVVAMDDSRGIGASPISLCSAAVSTDGGATFTRLAYGFNTTNGCYGDPSVFYSVRAAKWFISFFAERCPGVGMGQWESTDGVNWSESGCITGAGLAVDWLTSWVDNNPASPFYGRQYALFNDFNIGGGAIKSTFSTDDGVNWSTPATVSATFRRPVEIFGSLGSDGTVFVQALDEGGGGLAGPRTNYIYRSTDGGATWSMAIAQGAAFPAPGRSVNGPIAGMYSVPVSGYWRYQGWGQSGVGPSGIVHLVYSARPVAGSADPGNIYYVRSANNGTSWSAPLQLNTDATMRAQFQPSLAVNARGKLVATWFDERNTATDSLERYGRVSHDGGLTWSLDMRVSDVIFPVPLQPDPGIQSRYVGDKHEAMFSNNGYGNVAYDTWTDGRVSINGSPQQDVFFDKISLGSAPFDFDGDGKTDVSIFRPSVGQWWVDRSSNGTNFVVQFGTATDKLAPADFTGDGKTDITVWRPSSGEWFVLRSEDFSYFSFPFGTSGDIPAPADYDADGKADAAVFRPSTATWYVSRSAGGTTIQQFGLNGDAPVPSDYDGDGKADIAIFRPGPGEWWISRSTAGVIALQFGSSSDKPVQGDYTGDGKSDIAFWRPTTGYWFVLRSEDSSFFSFPFGTVGDVPAPGDYDGDGRNDATVFRPSSATWFSQRTTAGTLIQQFGTSGDRPIPNAFVP